MDQNFNPYQTPQSQEYLPQSTTECWREGKRVFCLPALTYLAAASIVAKRLHRHADNVNSIGIILHYIC